MLKHGAWMSPSPGRTQWRSNLRAASLCASGIKEFFDIEDDVDKIRFVTSDRKVEGAYFAIACPCCTEAVLIMLSSGQEVYRSVPIYLRRLVGERGKWCYLEVM